MTARYDGYLDNISSLLLEFHCREEKSWKYNRQLLLRCGRPLSLSTKVFMRITTEGIICLQHLINDDPESPLFIDCFIHPLEVINPCYCVSFQQTRCMEEQPT